MRYILRLELDLKTLGGEKMMGHLTDCLLEYAQQEIHPDHFRWTFTPAPEGFETPDLEKELRYATFSLF